VAKVGRDGQKTLKIIHILFASLWVGGSISLYLMVLLLGPGGTGEELYGYALSAKLVDDMVIIPGAVGTLVSGILISCLTHWGFFKHRFVAVKLVLTVVCILSGIFVLGPGVNGQPLLISLSGLEAIDDPAFRFNRGLTLCGGAAQILAILFMLAISTIKPWRRKKVSEASESSEAPEAPDAPA
jgi:putative copper export protein